MAATSNPRNPISEKLNKEILADSDANENEIIAPINAKLNYMFARKKAAGLFPD